MSDLPIKKKKLFRLKKIKNWLLALLSLSVILAAISFTLIRIAIKSIPDYKENIQQTVSEQLGVRLEVGSLDAEIYWLVPRLNLLDVKIYDIENHELILEVNEIDFSLDWINTLKTRIPAVSEVILDGMNLQIGVNSKSQLILQGFVVKEGVDQAIESAAVHDEQLALPISEELKLLVNNLDFKILNSNVRLFHEKYKNYNKQLTDFNLRLLNSGNEHKFEVDTGLSGVYGDRAHFIVELTGDLFDYKNLQGEAYMQLKNIHLAPWINDYWKGSALAINADVDTELWLNWHAQVITDVQGNFKFTDIAVHYLDSVVKTRKLEQLNGRVKWRKEIDGWSMNVRDMQSRRTDQVMFQPSAIFLKMSDLDQQLHLQADFLRIESLAYLSGMLFSLDERQVDWLNLLNTHKPTGDLSNLDVVLPLKQPENIKINTEFDRIGFALPESEPVSINNLQGSVIYYGQETWLALESDNVRLDFNKLFRNSIDITELKGILKISYPEQQVNIQSDSIIANTPHIKTENRLRLEVKGDASFMDLTTYYKEGNAAYTGLYLPAGIMGKGTVSWLDRSIKSGVITEGGYQFFGKLTDMPFANNAGISLAYFSIDDAQLEFLEDWPSIQNISAALRFENNSMKIVADAGQIYNSQLRNVDTTIASFSSPQLNISGVVDASLGDIPQYLLNSGIKHVMPEYMNNLQLKGKGELGLHLEIPLATRNTVKWSGELLTDNGDVLLQNENYRFTDVTGELKFSNGVFNIGSMTANIGTKPIDVSLKTNLIDELFIYSLQLNGGIDSDSVLSPLPEYKKYFTGSSSWDVRLDIMAGQPEPELRVAVKASSDLFGMSSTFYGPFAKSENENLPLEFSFQLYGNGNVKYDLNLANDRKISLHEFADTWLLTADTPSVKGAANIEKNQQSQFPLKIDLDYLDLNRFLQASSDTTQAKIMYPRDIPSMQFNTESLKWKNFIFNRAQFSTRQTNAGMEIVNLWLQAKDYQLNGSGSWLSGWAGNHNSHFLATADIDDLGNMLGQIKLTEGISDTSGKVNLDVRWAGAPFEFSWKALKGNANVSLSEGAIKDIDVGAGRMLGIFSLNTFMSLDFADQLSSGFSFDKAKGRLRFDSGNAYTRNFSIESKIADMQINGTVDIDAGIVDQVVRVKPQIASTVSLGGAVVAGPAVGGLIYLFHKVFDPDRLSEYEYSVKGSILDPSVELLSQPAIGQEQDDEDDYE